jgi:hypothetical protein
MKQINSMKTFLILIGLAYAAFNLSAQNLDFTWETKVANVKATVQILANKETVVLVPESNANMRYISAQLPDEYKKEGLKVTFNGWLGKIPPNVRMMGTPLKLTKIWVSSTEKKKFKLKKCRYTFKQ